MGDRYRALCRWSDGWALHRSYDEAFDHGLSADGSDERVRLSVAKYDHLLDTEVFRCVLSGFDDRTAFPRTLSLNPSSTSGGRVFQSSRSGEILEARRRFSWFLRASFPRPFLEWAMNNGFAEALLIPRHLPDAFRALEDPALDARAKAAHPLVLAEKGDELPGDPDLPYLDADLFRDVVSAMGSSVVHQEEGRERFWIEFFSTEGQPYWLVHGKISELTSTTHPDAVKESPPAHLPAHKPASWYVEAGVGVYVGRGETPAEALRAVKSFVWPGEKEKWMAENDRPGELVHDPSIFLAVGEQPPWFWPDPQFAEWAEEQ